MAMSFLPWDDPTTSDPLGFSQTTRKDPLVAHWTIEPDDSLPANAKDPARENRPAWKITVRLEAPADWNLATASSGTSVIKRISSQPLILSFDFRQAFPPLGPGPALETQWKTPGGPVFFRLDPQMSIETITEQPPQETESAGRTGTAALLPWFLLLLAVLIAIGWFCLGFWRSRGSAQTLARKWQASAPASHAPWPEWELWLARVERDWKEFTERKKAVLSADWSELGEILPQARFGRPNNPAWAVMMGKIKIMGRMDSLVKLGAAARR